MHPASPVIRRQISESEHQVPTLGLRIFSPPLYQLSYVPILHRKTLCDTVLLSRTRDMQFYMGNCQPDRPPPIGPVWIYPATCKTVANKDLVSTSTARAVHSSFSDTLETSKPKLSKYSQANLAVFRLCTLAMTFM